MAQKTIHLAHTKSTKGTHVFSNEEFALTLYLRKDLKGDGDELLFPNPEAPKSLTITVTTD